MAVAGAIAPAIVVVVVQGEQVFRLEVIRWRRNAYSDSSISVLWFQVR